VPREARHPSAEAVAAVVVCYFPDLSALRTQVRALAVQVGRVIVIDNTPGERITDLSALASEPCELHANGQNLGLARAQNEGIRLAAESSHRFVLLMDQDSSPEPAMVAKLLDGCESLQATGHAVGAVGPRWIDRHTNQSAPFVKLGWLGMRQLHCDGTAATIECDTLVASGCLIPLEVIDRIGAMDGDLFIDQIDIEWGLRAQKLGFRLYGVCDAVLQHGIGERSVRVWFLRWRNVSVHSPLRDYYIARNIVAVFFRRPAPLRWRLFNLRLLLGLLFVMGTQVPPRGERLRMTLRGIADGLRGRLGAFEQRAR
jgi:rhamnosyltransferase